MKLDEIVGVLIDICKVRQLKISDEDILFNAVKIYLNGVVKESSNNEEEPEEEEKEEPIREEPLATDKQKGLMKTLKLGFTPLTTIKEANKLIKEKLEK